MDSLMWRGARTAVLVGVMLWMLAGATDAHAQWTVETTAPVTGVVVGESTVVTATASPSVPAGYYLILYDADTTQNLGVCYASTTCQGTVNTDWSVNGNPQPRHLRAKVAYDPPSSYAPLETVSTSDVFTLHVRPYRFAVELTVGSPSIQPDGGAYWDITATTQRPPTDGGYHIRLWRKEPNATQPSSFYACSWSPCTRPELWAAPNTLVYATVQNSAGQVFGMSSQSLLKNSGAVRMDANGIDAAGLASLFASAQALCNELAVHRKDLQHYSNGSTISNEQIECETVANQGGSVRAAMAAVITAGGAAILAVIAVTIQRSGPGAPPDNPPPPGNPGDPPTYHPPTTVPPTLPRPVFRTDDIAAIIGARNPKMQLSTTQVETVTRNCQVRMIDAGKSAEQCGTLPIFVSGNDVQEPAQHDLDALYRVTPGPAPFLLSRKVPYTRLPPWYNHLDECQGNSPTLHCDEYPFQATHEGYPAFTYPVVDMRLVNGSQNTRQGGALARFFDPVHCDLADDGDIFIALPIPDSGVPTADRVCEPPGT